MSLRHPGWSQKVHPVAACGLDTRSVHSLDVIIAADILIAAVWALIGTNAQAADAREQICADEDERVVAAGDLWRPVRFLTTPTHRRRRIAAENALRGDAALWLRYERLRRNLAAWNYLESSVALALGASLLALVRACGVGG